MGDGEKRKGTDPAFRLFLSWFTGVAGAGITFAVKNRKALSGGKSRTQEVDDAAIFA